MATEKKGFNLSFWDCWFWLTLVSLFLEIEMKDLQH